MLNTKSVQSSPGLRYCSNLGIDKKKNSHVVRDEV